MIDLLASYNEILPASVLCSVRQDGAFIKNLQRYAELTDVELVALVKTCFSNLERAPEDTSSPDAELRLLLAPELCERIVPGTRAELRQVSTSLAEYEPNPSRPSTFQRILFNRTPWGTARRSEAMSRAWRWRQEGSTLRAQIAHFSNLSTENLVARARDAIDASAVKLRWRPSDFVYEPGFTYRGVPVVACRALYKSA